MNILVTGSTGFIGQHVVRWLVNNKYDVIATGTSIDKAKKFDWFNKVKFIPCDYFTEDINYYEYFERPDLLIHLAWKDAYQNTVDLQLNYNLPANMRFIYNFATNKKTKIVVIGTSQEYGNTEGCLHEKICANPLTPYAVAKNTLRSYLELISKENSLRWNWIRQFYLMGDDQNSKSFHGQIYSAIINNNTLFNMSPGEQQRDYIDVKIAAANICKIALQNNIDGIVNNCTGTPRSLKSIAEEYILEHDSKIQLNLGYYPYRENEVMIQYGNVTKLNNCIGDI